MCLHVPWSWIKSSLRLKIGTVWKGLFEIVGSGGGTALVLVPPWVWPLTDLGVREQTWA